MKIKDYKCKDCGSYDCFVKLYTKADYIIALHKEYGVSLEMAAKAHDKALEYLRSQAKMKG